MTSGGTGAAGPSIVGDDCARSSPLHSSAATAPIRHARNEWRTSRGLLPPIPARPPQHHARLRTRELSLLEHHDAVHHHVADAFRLKRRLRERRTIADAKRVEQHDVRRKPRGESAAVIGADLVRRDGTRSLYG